MSDWLAAGTKPTSLNPLGEGLVREANRRGMRQETQINKSKQQRPDGMEREKGR